MEIKSTTVVLILTAHHKLLEIFFCNYQENLFEESCFFAFELFFGEWNSSRGHDTVVQTRLLEDVQEITLVKKCDLKWMPNDQFSSRCYQCIVISTV